MKQEVLCLQMFFRLKTLEKCRDRWYAELEKASVVEKSKSRQFENSSLLDTSHLKPDI